MTLLDQVDEGVQQLAVAPLTPRSQRIKDLEAMVESQNIKLHLTINEAQGLIDKANGEARALQREKDEARWLDAHAPPGPMASLSAMPTPFEFGGFQTDPPRANPIVVPPPHHPPTSISLPTYGVWLSGGGPRETPFLSARGSLLSHVEISREVRKNREELMPQIKGLMPSLLTCRPLGCRSMLGWMSFSGPGRCQPRSRMPLILVRPN